MKRKIVGSVIGLLMVAGAVLGPATASFAATDLGGLSVQTACNAFKPGSTAVVAASNAAGWKCRKAWTSDLSVGQYMMSWACLQKYGSSYASYTNYNNPYSWRCYR